MDGKRFRILIADDRFRQVTVCAKSVHLDRLGPHRELGFVPVRDIIRLDEILRFQRDFRLLKSGNTVDRHGIRIHRNDAFAGPRLDISHAVRPSGNAALADPVIPAVSDFIIRIAVCEIPGEVDDDRGVILFLISRFISLVLMRIEQVEIHILSFDLYRPALFCLCHDRIIHRECS